MGTKEYIAGVVLGIAGVFVVKANKEKFQTLGPQPLINIFTAITVVSAIGVLITVKFF